MQTFPTTLFEWYHKITVWQLALYKYLISLCRSVKGKYMKHSVGFLFVYGNVQPTFFEFLVLSHFHVACGWYSCMILKTIWKMLIWLISSMTNIRLKIIKINIYWQSFSCSISLNNNSIFVFFLFVYLFRLINVNIRIISNGISKCTTAQSDITM